MSCWLHTVYPDHLRSGAYLQNDVECLGAEEGDDGEEKEPIPDALAPAPQPLVSVRGKRSRKGSASSRPPLSEVAAEGISSATSFSATPGARWTDICRYLQQRSLMTHVHLLDLSTVELSDTQWIWFSRDVLSVMLSLSSLKLAQMGLTDKRLAVLLRECRGAMTSFGRPKTSAASSHSSTALASATSEASPPLAGGFTGVGGNEKAGVSVNSNTVERRALRRLSVLDLSRNHLTYRSATPLGKFFLWAADTLDQVILSGNPLQDYGFQVLGIYLSKLQVVSLRRESHLFPPSLVRQYSDLVRRKERATQTPFPQHAMRRGSSCSMGVNMGDTMGVAGSETESVQIHLGISLLDLRCCQSTARGVSELLAGASRAHRLSNLLLSHNGVISSSVMLSKTPDNERLYGAAGVSTDDRGETFTGVRKSMGVGKFSSFEELHYPCMLTVVDICGVPLSKLCSPIGCRELFLNLFFCCRKLQLLDISESFDNQKLLPSLLLQVLLEGRQSGSSAGWRLQRELSGEKEFTLDTVLVDGQACVGSILCELVAHAAFNAQRRKTLAPPAFCHIRELHLRRTGITDKALWGLLIAVRSLVSTGVFSSLVVLNMADNLLTVHGCTLLVETFILNWPLPPSVMSDLALQGNAGIRSEDSDSITLLQKIAGAAVRKRREEQQARGRPCEKRLEQQQQEERPPLSLSIHFGALGGANFTVSSKDGESFTVPPEEKQLLHCKKGEDGNQEHQQESALRQGGRNDGEEERFPIFHLPSDLQAQPKSRLEPLVEVAASESFCLPFSAPVCGMPPSSSCDVSSIHARKTPQRFPSSMLASPSFLQWSPKGVMPSKKQQERMRGLPFSTPLLSPALESEDRLICDACHRISPNMNLPSESHTLLPAGAEPHVTVTEWKDQWALTGTSSCLQTRNDATHDGTLSQQKQPQSRRMLQDSSAPSVGNHSSSSVGYDFGCLFASMDAKKTNEKGMTSFIRSYDDGAKGCGDNECSHIGETRGVSSLHRRHRTVTEVACSLTVLPSQPLQTSHDEKLPVVAAEATCEELGETGTKSIYASEMERHCAPTRLLIKPPDEGRELTVGHERRNESTGRAAEANNQDGGFWEQQIGDADAKPEEMHQLANIIDAGSQLLRECDGNRKVMVPHEQKKLRRVRSFLISYFHPEGHVLCRGWCLLYRNNAVGANARACLEQDISTLLQPSDIEQWRVVVVKPATATVISSELEDSHSTTGVGATRLRITSNERRAVLAQRLQQHLNVGDGSAALPRFTKALQTAEEDTVEIVRSLLEAAHDVLLPVAYSGMTAEALVHEMHGREDSLVDELGAILNAAIDEEGNVKAVAIADAETPHSFSSPVKNDVMDHHEVVDEIPSNENQPQQHTVVQHQHHQSKEEGGVWYIDEYLPSHDGESQAKSSASVKAWQTTPSDATPCAENMVLQDAEGAETPTAITFTIPPPCTSAPAGSVPEEFVTGPPLRLAGRMKTFFFSLPHHEGHLLCRGWRLLHRADAVGNEARQLLEADVLSFLQSSSDFMDTSDASVARGVESVSFLQEGSPSTIKLQVVTNERRATVSDRLQRITEAVDDESMFPRFFGLLRRSKAYNTVLAVEAYLKHSGSEDLRAHIAGRYGTVKRLVHYFHGDDAAMLREIMASGMADVEGAFDSVPVFTMQATESEVDLDIPASAAVALEKGEGAVKVVAVPMGLEEDERKKGSEVKGMGFCGPDAQQRPVCMDATPARHSVETARSSDTSGSYASSKSRMDTSVSALRAHAMDNASRPIDGTFAEKLRGLQFLAYSAIMHGEILLDRQERHKLRICKGKWGRQAITIAVEWHAFLVLYFVEKGAFGLSSRKSLALVHPLVSGLQCFIDEENGVGDRVSGVHIHVERSHSPDELGISSLELQQKLHQLVSANFKRGISSWGKQNPKCNVSNDSMIKNTNSMSSPSSVRSSDSASPVAPAPLDLLQNTIRIRVALSSASKARKVVAAIQGARHRAVSITQQAIQVHASQQVDRPLPETPTS